MTDNSVGYQPGIKAMLARATDPSAAMQRARGVANVDVQTAAGAPQFSADAPIASPMQRALAKGSALSKLSFAGADLARRAGFDSLGSILRSGSAFRGASISAYGAQGENQRSTIAANMQAQQIRAAGNANMFGTVLGGLTSAASSLYGARRTYQADANAVNQGLSAAQASTASWGNDLYGATASQAREFV